MPESASLAGSALVEACGCIVEANDTGKLHHDSEASTMAAMSLCFITSLTG
jgi:hypothetical protein